MRGKKTSPEKVEEIKALSVSYSPATIAEKTGISLRTIYEILKRRDNPVIEAKREEKRLELVDKVWDDKEGEILKIKTKSDMILEAIDEQKIARSRLTELSTAYGILFDKRLKLLGITDEQDTKTIYNFIQQVKLQINQVDEKQRNTINISPDNDGNSSREQPGGTE